MSAVQLVGWDKDSGFSGGCSGEGIVVLPFVASCEASQLSEEEGDSSELIPGEFIPIEQDG